MRFVVAREPTPQEFSASGAEEDSPALQRWVCVRGVASPSGTTGNYSVVPWALWIKTCVTVPDRDVGLGAHALANWVSPAEAGSDSSIQPTQHSGPKAEPSCWAILFRPAERECFIAAKS